VRTSDNTVELLQALLAANIENPTKDAKALIPTKGGGSFSYEYADLPTILATVRPALLQQGVLVAQEAGALDGRTAITTRLSHAPSGQWLEVGPLIVPNAGDPQAVGSAITYGRRYQLLALLGLAAEDDDARSAQDTWEQATTKPPGAGKEVAPSPPAPGASPAVPDEGAAGSAPAAAAAPVVTGKDGGAAPAAAGPAAAGAPTFDTLRRLAGSAAAAREQVNRSNDKEYNARTIVEATEAEIKLAVAEWQETHP